MGQEAVRRLLETPAPRADPFKVKVYLVIQKDRYAKDGQPNERVVGAYLTAAVADTIAGALPDARVERHVAVK